MNSYIEIEYAGSDGLKLYARDYGNADAGYTLLCMPGLTRNSADFHELAEQLRADYRIIAVDQRGRGFSSYDENSDNYQPKVYVADMFALLDTLSLHNLVLVGTSLGGIMAMLMVASQPERFVGVVLNDIGPDINPQGLERIRGYVGNGPLTSSWEEAVSQTRKINAKDFPDFDNAQWLKFSKALYREDDQGRPRLAYDPSISKAFRREGGAAPPDLWSAYEAMTDLPTLLVRGELSDILHADCVAKMQRRKSDLHVTSLVHRGHAPTLVEKDALKAVRSFLIGLN